MTSPAGTSGAKMKVLLFANTDWYLYNFRLSLVNRLRDIGCETVLVVPDGPYAERLREAGCACISVDVRRRSFNPLHHLRLLYQLVQIYRREKPDVVHHFTIKCILFGSIAARLTRSGPVLNEFTGLGIVYASQGALYWALRLALAPAFRWILRDDSVQTIVQNKRDLAEIARRFGTPEERLHLVPGSGVDINRFVPVKRTEAAAGVPIVLMAGRLIRKKGIFDFMATAKLLRQSDVNAAFVVAGTVDPGNPDTLTYRELDELSQEGTVSFLGHVDDMAALMSRSDIAVLPSSYGEGVSRFLVEAASAGLPIVTTDVPGCRDVVEHGVNGLIVRGGDIPALADAVKTLALAPSLRRQLGNAGRQKVEHEFDQEVVLKRILEIYTDHARMELY